MEKNLQLIVMLTHNDKTVANALEVFEKCKDTKAQFWGFKEAPLPLSEMKELYAYMKTCGKTTFLEVVAYTEEEGMAGAKVAAECGCDVLMGTCFSDAINAFCHEHGLKYMPFVGHISGRPSVLEGSAGDMIQEAKHYLEKGAWGIDLLGYRYKGNAKVLIESFVQAVDAPVCLAGSINSFERLDEVKQMQPWAFTIGSAFFEHRFGDGFANQIDEVINYVSK